jgi:hypothetical protein
MQLRPQQVMCYYYNNFTVFFFFLAYANPSFPGKNTRKTQEEEEEPNETAQRGGEVQPADQHRSQIVVLWKPQEIESADDSHEREDRRIDRSPSMT